MNIFLTSHCPKECAIALDDLRLNKMLLETVQLLCTTWHELCGPYERRTPFKHIYKPTHRNHPCAKFVRSSFLAYVWTTDHADELFNEYRRRFGRMTHGCALALVTTKEQLLRDGDLLPDKPLIFSFNSSGFDSGDVHRDYQRCLSAKWQADLSPPKWTNSTRPLWSV